MGRALSVVVVWAIGATTAHAQMYKWTDENGRVHYGEQLPPGQRADSVTQRGSGNSASTAVPGGRQLDVPLPPPSQRDLDIRRKQQEYADREDREREERERAALPNSAAGIYYCQQLEQTIQKAQSGPMPRYDRPPGSYATPEEQQAFLKEMLGLREKNCR